ncbi:Intracellular distribution of mitochondria [Coemansia brasiliensis]|uniref:Intracellular distribution of mitochondria n=1 Tax=Coemansia brasiliensis TaxID=2650707 RepID=A0A9W8I893_9FUNG|nr:Intracellular distribution of mitochondria [Coemansia brasiliensis]
MSTAEKNVEIVGGESQTPVTETTADNVQQSDTPGIETPQEEQPYKLTVKAPNGAQVPVLATAQETVQDIKQVVSETPSTVEYSCFSLQFNGQRLNDFAELGELDLELECQLDLIEEEYTEREARLHVSRLRDLLTNTVTASADVAGVDAGVSVFDTIKRPEGEIATNGTTQSDFEEASTESKSDSTKKNKKKRNQKSKETEPAKESEEVTSHAFQDFEFEAVPQFDVLSAEKALKQLHLPQCVRQLVLSGWNPVPRHRHLQGDLLYLQVVTLENQTFQITSSRNGFFVNASSSTRFNPVPYSEAYAGQPGVRAGEFYCAHSLITLLRRISPKFAQTFDQLQAEMARHEPVEVLPFATSEQAATPWLVRNNPPQEYDSGRTQDVVLRQGAQTGDSLRDWNEELQSIRELPRSSLSERVLRDRQLHKWHAEFGEAAIRGAMAVVEGEMLALNPSDPHEQHMYLRDNIFYSKGFDGRETFADLGGDAAAHVATGKDITGVRLLNQLDVEGLNTLGSMVVDYRGVRVVAQSVVPGIFRRQETTQIVYGSIDSGNTVGSDSEFHKLVEPVAKALHFGEHTVKDAEGAEHKLFTSADVKGLTGTDGRKYLLDLYRMTPVDVEFLENECAGNSTYPHKLVLLRPELIDIYWENRVRKAVQEYAVEKAKKASEETKDEAAKSEIESQKEDLKITKDALAGFEFSLEFSPDAFTALQAKDSGEELASAVRDASQFLREVSVPALARDLASYTTSPLSGDALVTAMHQRGINMRYLGQIANLLPADVESARNVRRLVIFEMIARATKHILRKLFRQVPPHLHMEVFALVANGLVGTRYCADPTEYLSAAARAIPALAELKPEQLAAEIRNQIQQRFRFELDADFADSLVKGSERILLREICIKAGVQLALRDYKFERPDEAAVYAAAVASMGTQRLTKPAKRAVRARVETEMARKLSIEVSDVVNFVAVTKAGVQSASFADEAFEAGRVSLEQGQKALGLELLLESLALHEQTFGVLHPESARCYAVVSLAHYDAGEHALAAEFMTRAVVVSERTVGLDNPLTIHNYLNLALYEHARGNTLLALRLMRRAMDLWRLINSPDHPDLATAHNNIGVMLQSLRLHDDALRFFRSCLDIRRRLLGNEHILVANAQHSLAKALAITGDFKEAVQVERDAHAFFNSRFGAEDPRTRETAEWLSELTFNAVRSAKLSRAAQEKIRDIASAAANLVPVDRENSSEAKNAKGNLPIDELLKFITGSSNPKPKPGRRAKGPKGSRR